MFAPAFSHVLNAVLSSIACAFFTPKRTYPPPTLSIIQILTNRSVGIDIVINWNDVVRPTSLRAFKAHKSMFKTCFLCCMLTTGLLEMCPNVGKKLSAFVLDCRLTFSPSHVTTVSRYYSRHCSRLSRSSYSRHRIGNLRGGKCTATSGLDGRDERGVQPWSGDCRDITMCQGLCQRCLRDWEGAAGRWGGFWR